MVIHYAFRWTLRPDVDEVDVQSSPSQMDSNSAVSSSKEHWVGTADNEERIEKNMRKMKGEAGLSSPGLPIRGGGGGGGGSLVGGRPRLHSCFQIPGQAQEGSRLH